MLDHWILFSGKKVINKNIYFLIDNIINRLLVFNSGFDIKTLFSLLEKIHLMSHDTVNGIIVKIETFDLETFLRKNYFHHVFGDSFLKWIGKSITGETLKHIIVAVVLYKIFLPLRYLTTLTLTKVTINNLIKRGIIQTPPKGSSITEIASESKQEFIKTARMKKNLLLRKSKKSLNGTKSSNEIPKK